MQVTLREAETQLSALGKRAWAGERIVIAQDGEPYLELSPHQKERKRRLHGNACRRYFLLKIFLR